MLSPVTADPLRASLTRTSRSPPTPRPPPAARCHAEAPVRASANKPVGGEDAPVARAQGRLFGGAL